jgi:methylthioribose-1-phosphate isomerase
VLPEPIKWRGRALDLLDQRKLPWEISYYRCEDAEGVAKAIEDMVVRGAPAIGIAAAYGVALAASKGKGAAFGAIERLSRTRPTAVNLFWAMERMKGVVTASGEGELPSRTEALALSIHREDVATNRAIGRQGEVLLPAEAAVLTHCNAGALATGGYGTALGVIRAAKEAGKSIKVFVDETRPLLQGARLTAWELKEDGFDVTVVCDGAAAFVMRKKAIDAVIVGADRIAANGDVANKIGTLGLAIASSHFGTPFYVAAPRSSIDVQVPSGEAIPIEERDPEEVRSFGGKTVVPREISAWNPAFDVTPSELVSAIITEVGVLRPPYGESIERAMKAT